MADRDASRAAYVVVRSATADEIDQAGPSAEEAFAYARDRASGQLRYILELSADERGARCNCVCPGCEAPLTAVNAAKTDWQRRPHFRHPPGTLRRACSVGAARAAALRMLLTEGVIDLPRRTVSRSQRGLSGELYRRDAHVGGQRAGVRSFTLIDRVGAEVVLDDGRRLKVLLTGTLQPSGAAADCSPDHNVATIYIDVDDLHLASLPPAELRNRLRLTPSVLCWASHWDDDKLQREAADEASRAAQEALDWSETEQVDLASIPPELRRETLLHLLVKRILASAGRIKVPACIVQSVASDDYGNSIPLEEVVLEEQWFSLRNARTEVATGGSIPDVVAECSDSAGALIGEVCFEVTVSHGFDEARAQRARAAGLRVLEIDLAAEPGALTMTGLADRVCNGVVGKRWRALPGATERQAALDGEARALVARWQAEEAMRSTEPPPWVVRTEGDGLAAHRSEVVVTPQPALQRSPQSVSMRLAQKAGWRDDQELQDAILSFLVGTATGIHTGRTLAQVLSCVHRQPRQRHGLLMVAMEAAFAKGVRWPPTQWAKYTRQQLHSGAPEWQPVSADVALLAQRFPELRVRIEQTLKVRFEE